MNFTQFNRLNRPLCAMAPTVIPSGGSKRHDDAPQLVWVRNKTGAS